MAFASLLTQETVQLTLLELPILLFSFQPISPLTEKTEERGSANITYTKINTRPPILEYRELCQHIFFIETLEACLRKWRKKETYCIKIKYSTSEISDRLIVSPSDKYSSAVSGNMKRLNADILQDKGFLLSVAAASGSVASSSAGLIMEQIYFDSGSNVPWSINSLSLFSVLPSKRYCTGRHKEPLDASLFSGAVWLCDYHNGEKGRRS